MKLIGRKEFLKLPSGTVYCKFPITDDGDAKGMAFGVSAPSIKEDNITNNDFYSCTLGESMIPKGEYNLFDILFSMITTLGKDYPFEHSECRDGMFEDENVGFLIFSKEEVKDMINILQDSLKTAYNK